MLLVLRPFNVGDAVDIGSTSGVVDEIGLFVTEMHTFDNVAITMPNSRVWGNEIKNYSQNDKRRVDLEFGIAYDDDMDKAMQIVNEVLNNDERVLADPEPLVAISSLGDNSVGVRVRPWTETANFWPLRYALTKRIKERFDEEDISFPFPQRDVHFFNESE
jgi:small conductance mechanosensitive channel